MEIAKYILGGWLVIAIIFFMYGREKTWVLFFGQADLGSINFSTFTPSQKPNHALFCPENYCQNAGRKTNSPVFEFSTNDLRSKLFVIINAEKNIDLVASDDENLEYRYVHYTSLMRYPDTIRIKFIGVDAGRSTLAIFSESQIGNGDMGVNYKRINRWVRLLKQP